MGSYGQQMPEQTSQELTRVGKPLPAHIYPPPVRGRGSTRCTNTLTSGLTPLSLTQTPGTLASVAHLSIELSLSHPTHHDSPKLPVGNA
jgi:hypothetical protein